MIPASLVYLGIANGRAVSQFKSCYFLPRKGVLAGEVAKDMKILIWKAA